MLEYYLPYNITQAQEMARPVHIAMRSHAKANIVLSTLAKARKAFGEGQHFNVYATLEQRPSYETAVAETVNAGWAILHIGPRGADAVVEHIDRSQPLGTHIVILDDNTTSFRFQDKTAKQGEYFALVGRADEMMTQHGTHCWSINPCSNFWGHMGEMPEFKLNLQLIYGACFGFIATHKEELDTKFGQVKDDVERSLRFHRMDGQ